MTNAQIIEAMAWAWDRGLAARTFGATGRNNPFKYYNKHPEGCPCPACTRQGNKSLVQTDCTDQDGVKESVE